MPSNEYEDQVAYDLENRAKVCVSYRPLDMYGRGQGTGCQREVPIRTKAVAANGHSLVGIALRLPCDAAPDPLFRCPWYEPLGIERARDEMIELREAGARTLKALAQRIQAQSEER